MFVLLTFNPIEYIPVRVEMINIKIPLSPETKKTTTAKIKRVV